MPSDLVDQIGVAEVRRSLFTCDALQAERHALAARGWFADVVKMLRSQAGPSRADLERAAHAFFERLRKQVDVSRDLPDEDGPELGWNLDQARGRIKQLDYQLKSNQFGDAVGANVLQMLRELSVSVPQLSEELQALSSQLAARAERQQMRYLEHQLTAPFKTFEPDDDVFGRPAIGPASATTTRAQQEPACLTLAQAISEYVAAKRRTVGLSQLSEISRSFQWLQEALGSESSIRGVTKSQLRSFRDDLQRLDVTLRGHGQPFKDRLTNVEADQIKSVTSTRYWRSICAFFHWAAAEGLIDANPAAGLRIEPRKGEVKQSPVPFSEDELRKLFNTPLYAGYKSPKRLNEPGTLKRRDGHWWSAVLQLFTGMRAGEISQLATADFFFDDAIPHLKVRKGKTANAVRDVPLLPILLGLGLRQFVEQRAKMYPKDRVFREFRLGTDDRISDGLSKFWGKTLRLWGLHGPGRATHVMRHTFVAALRETGASEDEIGAFVGHAPRTITGTYGGAFPLNRKLDAALRLDFGFDVLKALGGPYRDSQHALLPE